MTLPLYSLHSQNDTPDRGVGLDESSIFQLNPGNFQNTEYALDFDS